MIELNLNQKLEVVGGNEAIYGLCSAATIGTIVAATNFWNPAGWLASTLVVAEVACVAYGINDNW